MKLFTNNVAATFTSVKQFVTYFGGNRALATIKQVNEVITGLIPSFKVGTYPNNLVASQTVLDQPILSSRQKFVFTSTIEHSAFVALVPGFKLNIADIGKQSELFSIDRLEVTIGYAGPDWDGGDLQLFFGNSLVATVPAATLSNTSGVANYAKTLLIPVSNTIVELASGSYNNPMAGPGVVFTNLNTIFNLRLSAPTTLFDGFIGVNVTASKEDGGCGTWCDPICDYNNPADHIYCSIIAGNKCNWCPGSGGSFTSTAVSPV